jgi:hypothetical protein
MNAKFVWVRDSFVLFLKFPNTKRRKKEKKFHSMVQI